MLDKDRVLAALNEVIDPEIGMSLPELNMIKEVNVDDEVIEIKMVLTVPFCPLATFLVEEVKRKMAEVAEGRKVKVVVLDEPWRPPESFRK